MDSYIKNLRANPYYCAEQKDFDRKLAEDMGSNVDELHAELTKDVLVKVR